MSAMTHILKDGKWVPVEDSSPVPVAIISGGGEGGGSTDGLTDAQLRASAVPVSVSGVATAAKQDTLAALVGEVQATPTSNTLLSRLKAIADKIPGLGSAASAGALPVVIASDQAVIPTQSKGASASATVARVASSASTGTLLAANANRRRVILYNESTSDLYIKFGATASVTSYTTKLGPGDNYESPTDWIYTGVIDGIWAAANGACQVTEL